MRRFFTKQALVLLGTGISLLVAAGAAHAGAFTFSAAPDPGDALIIKFGGYITQDKNVPVGNSGGRETTWGVGFISEIDDHTAGDSRIWDGNGANPQHTSVDFILYGIADKSFKPGHPGVLSNAGCTVGVGCDGKIHLDFYTFNGTDPVRSAAMKPSSRTGFSTVNGISNLGTPFMDWVLVPGDINHSGDAITTLYQAVNADVLPTTGSGNFLADCVSGPGCSLFGQNEEQLNGLTHFFGDIRGAFTLQTCQPRRGHPSDCPKGLYPNGFADFINDPAITVAAGVPEPNSFLLLAGGVCLLLGLARSRTKQSRVA